LGKTKKQMASIKPSAFSAAIKPYPCLILFPGRLGGSISPRNPAESQTFSDITAGIVKIAVN
jgi:hypothetical protein